MKKIYLLLCITFVRITASAQWETVYFPTFGTQLGNLVAVNFSDFNNGLAVGDSFPGTSPTPLILKTSDNGTTWNSVFGTAMAGTFTDVVYTTPFIAYAVGYHYSSNTGFISKSLDGGNTWSTITFPALFIKVSFPSLNIGYVNASNGSIYKTTDGGISWNPFSTPLSSLSQIEFINDTIGFASGIDTIIKTIDGGLSWSSYAFQQQGFLRIDFASDSIGYALFSDFGKSYLYKTIDQGVNWYSLGIAATAPAYTTAINFPNDNVGFICGQFQMYKTTDGGISWNAQTAKPPGWPNFFDDLMDLYFLNQDTGFAVGFNQYYRTSSGGLNFSENLNSKSTISLYPNPGQDQITLTLNFRINNSHVTIYDCFGKKVHSSILVNNEEKIDCGLFTPGIYFVTVNDGAKPYSKKLIIE